MTVRFSPSLVSNERCLSGPLTMTREPRVSDSATFSATCRQTLQRRNTPSPSLHARDWRSKVPGVDATVKLATAAPEGVKRSSGSAVRLPTTVMTVSPAMSVDLGAHQLRAEHRLVQVELPVELGDGRGLGIDVDDRVDALELLLDLVGEPATAPDVHLADGAVGLGDDGQEPVERRSDGPLLELRVEDDHQFVVTHGEPHLLWSGRLQSVCSRRVVHASRAPALPERAVQGYQRRGGGRSAVHRRTGSTWNAAAVPEGTTAARRQERVVQRPRCSCCAARCAWCVRTRAAVTAASATTAASAG